MAARTTIFVSYSHRDRPWLERLQVHLKPFARRGNLEVWDDTRLDPGDHWRPAIRAAIERAAASVLLISADFLASDFVATEELPPLLDRAERAGARVIPIVVQPCLLTHHPALAHFQSLNPPDRPLSALAAAEAEAVFVSAAKLVERVLTGGVRSSAATTDGETPTGTGDGLFAELQGAAVASAVLSWLASRPGEDFALTDLTRILDLRSRRLAHEGVERMVAAGWLSKARDAGRTSYRVSAEGARQWLRLLGATGGAAGAAGRLREGSTPVSRPERDDDPSAVASHPGRLHRSSRRTPRA